MKRIMLIGVLCFLVPSCSPEKKDPLEGLTLRDGEKQRTNKTTILGPKLVPIGLYDQKGKLVYDRICILAQTTSWSEAYRLRAKKGWEFARIANVQSIEFDGKKKDFIVYTKQKDYFDPALFRVRNENFNVDKTASYSDYFSLYRNYQVTAYKGKSTLLVIQQKKMYIGAEPFVRLIGFDTDVKRTFSKTFYGFNNSIYAANGRVKIIVLQTEINQNGHFPSFKLLVFDNLNRIVNEIHSTNNRMAIEWIKPVKNGFDIRIRVQEGCTMCEWDFYTLELKLNRYGKLVSKNVGVNNGNPDKLINRPKGFTEMEP